MINSVVSNRRWYSVKCSQRSNLISTLVKICIGALVFECKCFTKIIESPSQVKMWLAGVAFLCVVEDKILWKICLNTGSRSCIDRDFSLIYRLLHQLLMLVTNIPKPGVISALVGCFSSLEHYCLLKAGWFIQEIGFGALRVLHPFPPLPRMDL